MTNIYMLLLMSVSGTVMYALSMIFGKKTRYYLWQYAMLVTAVIMLLVPIQKIVEIPRLFTVTVPKTLNISEIPAAPSIVQPSVSAADIITAVWLIGASIFAVRMVYRYIKTSLMLRQITEECCTDEILSVHFNISRKLSVKRSITLRSGRHLNSPLLFGIFKPSIIIPDRAFSERELEMILMHELTHYKHRDLWIALAASVAQCIHWFNPAVYFIGKSVTDACELFCDETVVKRLNPADKKAYGSLILSVIEKELNSRLAYTTSMASAKNSIQKRLRKIVEFKMPTKASTVAGIMAVCACSVSSLTAFGFETAAEVIPEEIKQIIPVSVPAAAPVKTPVPISSAAPVKSPVPISSAAPAKSPVTISQSETDAFSAPVPSYPDDSGAEHTEQKESNTENTYVNEDSGEDVIEEKAYEDTDTKTSFVFNADFEEDYYEIQSGSFRAEEGTKLSINKVTGSKDIPVSVHDAATGDVIYDEREDKIHDSFSMSVPAGGEYYVSAYSENADSAGIYICGE